LLAIWGRTVIAHLLAGSTAGLHYDFSLNLTVMLFSLALAFLTAMVAGLLPSFRASQADPASGLKSRGALGVPSLASGRVLVSVQICVSLLLVTVAGLYARTLLNLTRIDAGFSVERLLLAGIDIRASGAAKAHTTQFYQQAQNAIAAIPGVQSVTITGFPLLANRTWGGGFGIRGREMQSEPSTSRLSVSETFFSTFGIPILQGRAIEALDTADSRKVVVVNESLVRNYFPGESPIGLTLRILGQDWQIVGVCRDVKYDSIKKAAQPVTYFPYRQMLFRPSLAKNLDTANIAVRTTSPPLALSTAIRQAVSRIDPDVSVASISTQKDLRDQGISQERMLAALCGFLASLTILLSCIGLYGLMAYNVTRRTSEIAIRMAIGARRGDVAKSVLREALALAGIGIGAGLPAVLILTRLIQSQLYGVRRNDPMTLIFGSLALVAVALLAAWIPARRATRIEPIVALRSE
jgi:predicted permease